MSGSRGRGVFETAHGIGENIRGRTLGAIDDVTHTGSTESKSHHASLADRGRLEAETGMAHISGYADPNVYYRSELDRMSNPAARTIGNDHTTGTGPGRGYVRAEEEDYYGQHDRADGGVGRGRSGYGTDHGYGHRQAGVRGFEHQRLPPVDQNPGQVMGPVDDDKGGLSPNRNHQNTGSEAGWTSMSHRLGH